MNRRQWQVVRALYRRLREQRRHAAAIRLRARLRRVARTAGRRA